MIPSKPTKIPIALTTMSPMSSHNTLHSRRGQMCTVSYYMLQRN